MKRLGLVLPLLAMAVLAQSRDGGRGPVVTVATGLSRPSSALYDAETDTYLVSNVGGEAGLKDNDGFITELSPDGAVVNARLVAGGSKGVTLNAPKGLAIHGGVLYVADIDTVRMFDRATGASRGEVKVVGSTFVDALALGPDGRIYLTDSGLGPKLEGTGTDGVYVIEPGVKPTLKTLLKARALKGPSGLVATHDSLYVVTLGAAELITLDLKGNAKGPRTELPKGVLHGVVMVGDELVISSWEGGALYRGKPGGPFRAIATGLSGPADLGHDVRRHRVLVPCSTADRFEAWELE